MYKIFFNKEAEKQYRRFPNSIIPKIRRAILNLSKNPYVGKKLEGRLAGKYSFRAWPYRILYLIDNKQKTIVVVSILHRQGAYK